MKTRRISYLSIAVLILVMISSACEMPLGAAPTETPTASPTATAKPTATPKPTYTPKPTATPNVAATQRIDEFNSLLEDFLAQGYVASTEGEIVELDDFKQEWAQLYYYDFFPPTQEVNADFVFKSHVKWSTAADTSDLSGCGIAFGLQDNGDHYVIFLDKSRIAFGMNRGTNTYQVGKTRGSGRLSFGNPAEADLVVAVKEKSAFVSVDGEVTEYTLSADQTTHGTFSFSLLSGTNRDYGTRCEMTDNILWIAGK